MKEIIGILVTVLGIAAAIYVGVWLLAICGIVQIVEACKAEPLEAWGIAIGIVRVSAASFVGWAMVAFSIFLGVGIFQD
jgi:hypothetical protein